MSSHKFSILISSASSRTGYDLTAYFLRQNFFVIAFYHSQKEKLEKLLQQYPSSLRLFQIDLQKEQAVTQTFDRVRQVTTKLDCAIHSYGPYLEQPLQNTSFSQWRSILSANLDSSFLFSQACFPLLQANDFAHLFFFTYSHAEHIGYSKSPAYHISKNAILQLTRQLAVEWGKDNIAVNAIAPGILANSITKTDVNPATFIPQQRFGTHLDFAPTIHDLIVSRNVYITGTHILASGGYSL